jgi:RimJ/RimL family protein N-acetyltransferase
MRYGRLPFPIALTGEGITLREWRPDDLDDLVQLLDETDVARWTPITSPFDVAAGVAYLKRAHQGRTSGQRIQLAITTDGERPLGEVLLFGQDTSLAEAELGYVVGAAHRGRGLATRALALLSGYAQSELALVRLVLRIDAGNAASRAVARRCGFRLTGEPPILQEGAHGLSHLDTWELVNGHGPASPKRHLDRRARVPRRHPRP